MAPRYNVGRELVGADGLVSVSPRWVVGFARFASPVTYDIIARASFSSDPQIAYTERPRLVVTSDCVGVNVSESKGSHTISASFEFTDSGKRYLNEILPGDWVVVNMLYDEGAAADVAQRMTDGKPINKWEDGLKFVGRVTDIGKVVRYAPSGHPQSTYSISAVGMSELDSMVMYYPELAKRDILPVTLEQFGVTMSKIVRGGAAAERGAIDINRIIPTLLEAIFNVGAWARAAQSPVTGSPSPNQSYIIPRSVAQWFGLPSASDTPKLSDLLVVHMGVQKFSQRAKSSNDTVANPWDLFQPDGLEFSDGAFRTSSELIGSFPINSVPQSQTTVWSILSQYMNWPLNESVVVMRSHVDGRVYPILTIRQTPYTTEQGAFHAAQGDYDIFMVGTQDTKKDRSAGPAPTISFPQSLPTDVNPIKLAATRFMELPRWFIPSSIVSQVDVGRSDSLRFNLTYIQGTGPGIVQEEAKNFVRAPPVKDTLDILRNGVRPYQAGVNCFIRDLVTGPIAWRDLMADIVMGQHLTLSGRMVCQGIRAPIAPGDNIEFEGLVCHIESLQHQARVAPDGVRSWTTTLSLSRGVLDTTGAGANFVSDPATTRQSSFANVKTGDVERPEVAGSGE